MLKNIVEVTGGLTESKIDSAGKRIKEVCYFGSRHSLNNRTYSDRAVNELMALSEGVKVFCNHPSKKQLRELDGNRDINDWIGVGQNVKREGDKIIGDLYCREQYFPLMRDIARLQPKSMGMSLNARCHVGAGSTGKETIESVESLRSYDCVETGATVSNLFASLQGSDSNRVLDDDEIAEIIEQMEYRRLGLSEEDKHIIDEFVESLGKL